MDYFLWAVTLVVQGVLGLKLIKLDVPGAVVRGDPIWLNCTFDLEQDELYSIKWYKNNVEFYRYLPTDDVVTQKYDMMGVYVDLDRTRLGNLYLYRSDLYTEGVYRCEISAEAPSFQTVRNEKEVRIYVMPEKDPEILGIRSHYQLGEEINGTCLTGPSKPSPYLTWFINGKQATPGLSERAMAVQQSTPISTSTLPLQFAAEPQYFRKGYMKISCNADIAVAYSVSHDEIVVNNKTLLIGYRPSFLSSKEDPSISGENLTYQIGDLVELNCSSSKSQPMAHLQWYINNIEVALNHTRQYPPIVYPDGQKSSKLALRLVVQPFHFHKEEMRIRCTSTLFRIISSKTDKNIYIVTQPPGVQYSKSTREVLARSSGDLTKLSWWIFIMLKFSLNF